MERAERIGLKVSDCFLFSGWSPDYIRLELAEMILPKGTKLAEMISQLLVKALYCQFKLLYLLNAHCVALKKFCECCIAV